VCLGANNHYSLYSDAEANAQQATANDMETTCIPRVKKHTNADFKCKCIVIITLAIANPF